MILRLFAVRDRATDQFGNPFCVVSKGQAIRSFSDEINRDAPDNGMRAHAEDFDLYYLGEFDTDKGRFTTNDPEMVAVGKDLKV